MKRKLRRDEKGLWRSTRRNRVQLGQLEFRRGRSVRRRRSYRRFWQEEEIGVVTRRRTLLASGLASLLLSPFAPPTNLFLSTCFCLLSGSSIHGLIKRPKMGLLPAPIVFVPHLQIYFDFHFAPVYCILNKWIKLFSFFLFPRIRIKNRITNSEKQ